MNYHGHIYYRDIEQAQIARQILREQFGIGLKMFPLREKAIGPHPVPSFGLAFEEDLMIDIRLWMKQNTDWMTGLIHPIIADDLVAHTTYAEWIGGKVELDVTRLSSPPMTWQHYSLREKATQPVELDINSFDICRDGISIGDCTLGAHYVQGRSVLDSCQIYKCDVAPSCKDAALSLLLLYLRGFTDCQRIFISAQLDWMELDPLGDSDVQLLKS